MTVSGEFDRELTVCSAAVEYIRFQVFYELKHKHSTVLYYFNAIKCLYSCFSISLIHVFWSVLCKNGSRRQSFAGCCCLSAAITATLSVVMTVELVDN